MWSSGGHELPRCVAGGQRSEGATARVAEGEGAVAVAAEVPAVVVDEAVVLVAEQREVVEISGSAESDVMCVSRAVRGVIWRSKLNHSAVKRKRDPTCPER